VTSCGFLGRKPIAHLQRRDLATMKAEILDHRDKYFASLRARELAGPAR